VNQYSLILVKQQDDKLPPGKPGTGFAKNPKWRRSTALPAGNSDGREE
jgi:hypothetical protein